MSADPVKQDTRQRMPLGFAIITAFVALLTSCIWYVCRGRYQMCAVFQHVPLNYTKSGVSVDIVEYRRTPFDHHIVPAMSRVRVLTPDSTGWLHSLNDLRGLVRIRSATEALAYVRWNTNSSFYYAEATNALEVQSFKQATIGPNDGYLSGDMAIISNAAFKQDGFAPPVVTVAGGVYHVVRWVCVFESYNTKPAHVQLRDEIVGSDGRYSYKILIDKTAPTQHGESWRIEGLA